MSAQRLYSRQRFLLDLLRQLGGAGKRDLQKQCFLLSQERPTGYHFMPYRYGGYSFQLQRDLDYFVGQKMATMQEDGRYRAATVAPLLSGMDTEAVSRHVQKYGYLRGNALVAHVYKSHPYYAINSEMLHKIPMSEENRRAVQEESCRLAKNDAAVVYTIGYEGITLEEYANKLIRHNIALLCDVRKNAMSRKFGFGGGMLRKTLAPVGIAYVHLPDLGIESAKRQDLQKEGARAKLFDEYRRRLPAQTDAMEQLLQLQQKHKRIALTCFEKAPEECHRHCVGDRLGALYGLQITHIQ